MASYLDKVTVNTAITDNTKNDLGHQHITSADFMQLNVATIMELVPGSKLDVKMETFARLNPLPVPTFGRASIRNRAFFVPFRTVFRGFTDFLTDAVHVSSNGYNGGATLLSTVATVNLIKLREAFTTSIGTDVTSDAMLYVPNTTLNPVVDVYIDANNYYCYTVRGRQAVKILEQLGYKLDWDLKEPGKVVSALPLLALARIYVDYYFPQQYSNISVYDRLLALCNYDVSSGPLTLDSTDVALILNACQYVQYDSDLFVSAWDQPNQPNVGNYSNFKLVNIDSVGTILNNGSNVLDENGYISNNSSAASSQNRIGVANAAFISPVVNSHVNSVSGVSPVPISEYLLHSLHALTDYMKRHQLAGSRAFDRYLARFGKALPAEKMNRSLYLGVANQDIQIGDVMSTSDTEGANLGSYAGKGISYGQGHFDFNSEEFGYFIVLSSIVPATGYYQGLDPLVERISKLDFWTPEFDSLGVEPIKAANLFIPQYAGQMQGNPYEQVFGFVPRYASYKCPTCMDRLTGTFRLPSLNGSPLAPGISDSWHLMRSFYPEDFKNQSSDTQGNFANVVHTPDFISGGSDFSQFNRIFFDGLDVGAPDNFSIIHNFEIAEYSPWKSLYDEYQFEDKGKEVTLETNGVKMN